MGIGIGVILFAFGEAKTLHGDLSETFGKGIFGYR